MGGLHVVVEVAARDVARTMQFHKVHPQVQEEVNRRMQLLVRLSVTNLQLRENAPNVPATSVVSWVLEDIVSRVVDVEIPKIQVADAEMKMANLRQELSLAHEALAEHEREMAFVQVRLKHMDVAKEYMMQSYFREVATLRHHIAELESQHPPPSRNSSQPHLSGKRLESISLVPKGPRHGGGGSDEGGACMGMHVYTPTSTLLGPAPPVGSMMGSSGMLLALPPPSEQQLDASGVEGSGPVHHHSVRPGGAGTASLGFDDRPSTPLRPLVSSSSLLLHAHASPLNHNTAVSASDGGPRSGDAVLPTHEVDALFDYQAYVAITNEAITSWPQRYDALQKKFADTVHSMQLAAASAALQSGKQIATLQKELMDRDARLTKLSGFVRMFHPIVMQCVKTVQAQMAEANQNLRRDMKALQNSYLDSVVALSDRLFDLDLRHQLFTSFVTYCSDKLQHKLRLVQEGHRVRATHGKPLWQFFLIAGKDDAYAGAKTFWQDQACVKEILENYKQALLTLERISINAFGPPSDDEDWTSKEFEETALAKPIHRNSSAAVAGATKGGSKTGAAGGSNKASGRGGGKAKQAAKAGAATSRGSASRSPSNRQRMDSSYGSLPDDSGKVPTTTSPSNRSENTTPLPPGPRTGSMTGQDAVSARVSPNTSLREDALLREMSTPVSGSSVSDALQFKPQTSPPLQRPLTRENSVGGAGVGGGGHRGSIGATAGSGFRKGEDFIQNLLRRTVDAKLRRIMCRVRRTVFLRRLPVEGRNLIIRMQKIDDELKSADAAVERYEKRKHASESKLRKDVISQSLTGGSLFSSLHNNKKALGGAHRSSLQSSGVAPPRGQVASSYARKRSGDANAIGRSGIEADETSPPSNAHQSNNALQHRQSIDSSDLLQSFTAFGGASGGDAAALGASGGGGGSSQPHYGVPVGTNWASQLLGHTTAVSCTARTSPGGGADAATTRGFTPLSATSTHRRGSDVSFHGVPDSTGEQHLEAPTGTRQQQAVVGQARKRSLSSSADDALCGALMPPTPLPLLMISRSPQPTPCDLNQPPLQQHIVQRMVQQSVDADDVDSNVFRIQSLSARRVAPGGRGGGSGRGSSDGRLTHDDDGKLALVIPTLSAATSRSIADRSREAYAQELQLRATPVMKQRLCGATPSTPPAQLPLPDLRQQALMPAMMCRQATPQFRTPRTPSSSPRVTTTPRQ